MKCKDVTSKLKLICWGEEYPMIFIKIIAIRLVLVIIRKVPLPIIKLLSVKERI